jgi:2-hydroxychromene-2-carboxylate isomerase
MSVQAKLKRTLVATLTHARTRRLLRQLQESRRRLRGEPHRVRYFHQVDDPYSQLAVQLLPALSKRYAIELVPVLVGPAPDAAAPERQRLIDYSRKDAADIAPYLRLAFEDGGAQPDDMETQLANRILASVAGTDAFASLALEVGEALWRSDRAALEQLAKEHAAAEPGETARMLAEGDALRTRLRHYLSATFHYGGEWYWGVDRVGHLERRLGELGLRREAAGELLATRRLSAPAPSASDGKRVTVEFYPSLRSPYTYISMPRVYDLAERLPVDLVLRPVLPMVMRGLPVPAAKQLYITLDTKREAERVGLPFGRIADPVGRAVERGLSLFPYARDEGRGAELLLSFCSAAFAEGIEMVEDDGLRPVVERAGLLWSDAVQHVDGDAWREEIEANRAQMFESGLWGVPSFRIPATGSWPEFATWGQDRIWLLEEEVKKRLS